MQPLWIVTFAAITACATHHSATQPTLTATGTQPPSNVPSTADGETPVQCSEASRPLDAAGTARVVELQQYLVDAVVSDEAPVRGLFNTDDIHQLIRDNPAAELAFIFPKTMRLPTTTFRVRTAKKTSELKNADHPIFFVELSGVGMVGSGNELGLVLDYSAWPTGAQPKQTVWMWGVTGQYCVIRGSDGVWTTFPIGAIIVS